MLVDQNLYIFLLFIKMGTKIQWSKYSNFIKYLINRRKKMEKNVKFDLFFKVKFEKKNVKIVFYGANVICFWKKKIKTTDVPLIILVIVFFLFFV